MATTTGSDAEKAPAYVSEEKGGSGLSSRDGDRPVVGEVSDVTNFAEVGELKQGLKQRHIQMIALAGAIGTVSSIVLGLPSLCPHTIGIDTDCAQKGLFLGSGSAIAKGGPLGAL